MARPRDQAGAFPAMMRQRGFALLIVLMALGFLALLGTQIASAGRNDLRVTRNLIDAARLDAAVEGGIAHAAFAALAADDPGFRPGPWIRTLAVSGVAVSVRLQNESDRVNPNTASEGLLRALIAQMGATPSESVHLAAAILDWRTAGKRARPNGAKVAEYQAAGLAYGPPESPFQTVDELRFVLGMNTALFDRIAPHLTVWTDSDPDMTTQDAVVAQALVDSGEAAQGGVAAPSGGTETVLRVTGVASAGTNQAALTEVVAGDLSAVVPRLRILFRARCDAGALNSPLPSCP